MIGGRKMKSCQGAVPTYLQNNTPSTLSVEEEEEGAFNINKAGAQHKQQPQRNTSAVWCVCVFSCIFLVLFFFFLVRAPSFHPFRYSPLMMNDRARLGDSSSAVRIRPLLRTHAPTTAFGQGTSSPGRASELFGWHYYVLRPSPRFFVYTRQKGPHTTFGTACAP